MNYKGLLFSVLLIILSSILSFFIPELKASIYYASGIISGMLMGVDSS